MSEVQTNGLNEPTPKRVKLTEPIASGDIDSEEPVLSVPEKGRSSTQSEIEKEVQVGIIAYVDPHTTKISGTLKKRYSDFLVNEILPDGQVLHLRSTRASTHRHENGNDHDTKKNEDSTTNSIQHHTEKPLVETIAPKPPNVADSERKTITDGIPGAATPTDTEAHISEEDRQKLVEYLNENAAVDLINLHESIIRHPYKKSRDYPTVRTEFTSDRSLRTQIHQFIRQVFNSRIESSTDNSGVLELRAASPNSRGYHRKSQQQSTSQNKNQQKWRPGKLGWQERGGEYLHFSLYKENKDTMEAISWLVRQLKCNAKNFQFAGTKDRRAVTVQRCSAYRIDAERLAGQNRSLRNASVGDFEYKMQGLELGDLQGNEFVITLRDCSLFGQQNLAFEQKLRNVREMVEPALKNIHKRGYLNYYGQQRFGTFSLRTDSIGLHILKEDFRAACDAILYFPPEALAAAVSENDSHDSNAADGAKIGQDDRNRALAIHDWRTGGNLNAALELMPRKFSGESHLMRHLHKNPSDFFGGLMMIQRNLRLMYVHAYQSLVWNSAVTNRWKLHGDQVVKGDLVLVNEHKEKEASSSGEVHADVDADGEVVVQPEGVDRANQVEDIFERARPLSAEEAASGQYSVFDLVLPLPGFDVEYPRNESGEFYKTFMGSEEGGGLDPYNMRRKQRDFSLSGGYRKMLARIGPDYSFETYAYTADEEQFVETDLDRLKNSSKQSADASIAISERAGDKIAVVLKFQLGSSQYATMALRELSKGGIQAHKGDYSGGR